MSDQASLVNVDAEALKEQGNVAFRNGDFAAALPLYGQAIDMDPQNAKYLVNRSLCYASLGQWDESLDDAKKAAALDSKFQKAHYRIVKAMFELCRFKEARLAILNGLKECGESKEMKQLEEELMTRTGIPLRPKSTDFEIIGELGDGNFSKVFKAQHKPTGKVYAIKTIEKMTVDRMKKRHGNINNEILMEKRALNRLDHPGIVQLYNTFQDYGTLYYQMEYVAGRDLWDRLHDPQLVSALPGATNATGAGTGTGSQGSEGGMHMQVGCHWSLARFYLAEAINAVEHMHRRGIAHRDIKPENMIISADGHLKFVDFGTAKDFIQTDLNGPEFVGTPEYLSPSTVANKACGVEADLWALGVVLFQMLLGYTPFGAPSPYLTFLRIKRTFLQIPEWVPVPLASMIRLLLQPDPAARLRSACGVAEVQAGGALIQGSAQQPSLLSYDALRAHDMFRDASCTRVGNSNSNSSSGGGNGATSDPSQDAQLASQGGETDELSTVDGVRTVYERPAQLAPTLRELCLRAVGRAAVVLAEATAANGGVRPASPAWMKNFDVQKLPALDRTQIKHYLVRQQRLHTTGVYRLFCGSLVEARSRRSELSTGEYLGLTRQLQGHWDRDFHFLQMASPRFGAAALSKGGDGCSVETEESQLKALISSVNKLRPRFLVMQGDLTAASTGDGAVYEAQIEALRKCMARVSETIPVLYCPGSRDVGAVPTAASLAAYRARFGADYFGFWYGGVRGLILNSSLLIHPEGAPQEAARQETWFTEEIEQCKLCSNAMVLFTYHPWFLHDMDEPDSEETIPKAMRHKWLGMLRHHKVKLAFTSRAGPDGALRPYPAQRKTMTSSAPKEAEGRGDHDPEAKPSEIIAEALRSGELQQEDVTPPPPETREDSHNPQEPPAAPKPSQTGPGAAVEEMVGLSLDEGDSDRESDYEAENPEHGGGGTDSAEIKRELDEAAAATVKEDDDVFLNVEEDCEGPEMLFQPSASTQGGCAGLRAVLVQEHEMRHRYYPAHELPASQTELLAKFA